MSWPTDVSKWHESMGLSLSGNRELGMRLIDEEATELDEAIKSGDRAEILKETLDLIWVLLGNLMRHGIAPWQIAAGWNALFWSNMSKKGGKLDEHGKLTKPDTYRPADMASVLGDRE